MWRSRSIDQLMLSKMVSYTVIRKGDWYYTPLASNMVQALVESGREFVLFMEGLNDAQEGLPFNIRVHRVKFSPVQNLGFISDDFANIPLQLDVLSDPTITGQGLSPFMQLDLAQ